MKDVVAAQTRKCGADVNQEWPVQKRQERLAEIRTAGEAAFRAARTARTAKQSSGPSADELIFSATEEFDDFYNWMWDVVRAFCKSLDDGLIVKDKNGRFEFGFSHAKPFSYFMSQREAELEYAGCIYVKTHDELLDLLELQR